jgi:hypothetical protein
VSPGPASFEAAAAAAAAGVPPAPEPRPNIQRLPMLQQLLPGGSAVLQDGQVLQGLDAIVYCTGYKHTYPFLEHLGLVESSEWCGTLDDNHVPSLTTITGPCAVVGTCILHIFGARI